LGLLSVVVSGRSAPSALVTSIEVRLEHAFGSPLGNVVGRVTGPVFSENSDWIAGNLPYVFVTPSYGTPEAPAQQWMMSASPGGFAALAVPRSWHFPKYGFVQESFFEPASTQLTYSDAEPAVAGDTVWQASRSTHGYFILEDLAGIAFSQTMQFWPRVALGLAAAAVIAVLQILAVLTIRFRRGTTYVHTLCVRTVRPNADVETHLPRPEIPSISVEDIEILGLFVTADEVAAEPQTFVMTYVAFKKRAWAGVVGWPEGVEVPSEHKMDDLSQRGWLRTLSRQGKTRQVAVAPAGRQAWATHVAQLNRDPTAVDLSWSASRVTLQRAYDLYRHQGAPTMGAWIAPLTQDPTSGHEAEAHVGELVRSGYLEVGRNSAAGPTHVRPTVLTHQMLGGWPAGSAQAALDEFVHDIDVAIERAPDETKRSKLVALRDLLAGAGREIALAWVEKKIGA
jgi:hypothetical protein